MINNLDRIPFNKKKFHILSVIFNIKVKSSMTFRIIFIKLVEFVQNLFKIRYINFESMKILLKLIKSYSNYQKFKGIP
jgi:hypothetical protein